MTGEDFKKFLTGSFVNSPKGPMLSGSTLEGTGLVLQKPTSSALMHIQNAKALKVTQSTKSLKNSKTRQQNQS